MQNRGRLVYVKAKKLIVELRTLNFHERPQSFKYAKLSELHKQAKLSDRKS